MFRLQSRTADLQLTLWIIIKLQQYVEHSIQETPDKIVHKTKAQTILNP